MSSGSSGTLVAAEDTSPRSGRASASEAPSPRTTQAAALLFQTRRRRAAKLTRFFGVDYTDIQTSLAPSSSGTPPVPAPAAATPSKPARGKNSLESDEEDEDDGSMVIVKTMDKKKGKGHTHGVMSMSRPATPFDVVVNGHAGSEMEKDGDVRVLDAGYRPEDVQDVLGRLRKLH